VIRAKILLVKITKKYTEYFSFSEMTLTLFVKLSISDCRPEGLGSPPSFMSK